MSTESPQEKLLKVEVKELTDENRYLRKVLWDLYDIPRCTTTLEKAENAVSEMQTEAGRALGENVSG